jgi:CheY-like chemotaxis protein
MPHGTCFLWRPDILTLHVIADSAIALAYFSIPFALLYFVRRRKDPRFNWIFVCFAVFIIACGTTHLMEIWTIWQPLYWISGVIKAITALASVPTAILLVRLIPQALRWPSPAALQRANASLEVEVAERKRAEAEVRRINDALEIRMVERTRELEAAYQHLRQTQEASLQQERLLLLERLASDIVHDINNALTPATLYTQSLLDHEKNLSREARNDLSIVQQAMADVICTLARIKQFYSASPANAVRGPVEKAKRQWRKGLRILVVDDDELLRQSMRAILEREGHSVSVAHGGRAGIDVFTAAFQRGERFDTVITDLGMPHVDGRDVAVAVKNVSPHTPVILLTGWGQQLRQGNEIPAQVDHLLNKPASLTELRAALAGLFSESA